MIMDHTTKTFRHLLVVMTDRHIGNLLVSLYAIKSAEKKLDSSQQLICVIDYHLIALAEYLLPNTLFIPYKLRGKNLSPFRKLSLLYKLLRQLRKHQCDAAVDLYGHSESYWIAKLSGASFISAYFSRPQLKARYDWNNESTSLKPSHQLDYYTLPFIPHLGALPKIALQAPRIPEVIAAVNDKLEILGATQRPLVIIHPGAGKAYKLWPIAHWQKLISMLENNGATVVLIGAGIDIAHVKAILRDKSITPIDASQQFDLIETIQLGFIADLMIGNDSGPTHLLATTPCKVISLFGPTDEKLWAPLSANAVSLKGDQACLPSCKKGDCQRPVSCMESLRPERVLQQAARHNTINLHSAENRP